VVSFDAIDRRCWQWRNQVVAIAKAIRRVPGNGLVHFPKAVGHKQAFRLKAKIQGPSQKNRTADLTEHESEQTAQPEVWQFDDHPGFRGAIESAGTAAAPLLAGFAFTLFVLVVPTLGEDKTLLTTGKGTRLVTESNAFSAAPELAAGLLLFAGLLLIFSLQAAIYLQYHNLRPSDLAEWYPEYFPESVANPPEGTQQLGEWSTADWPAMRVENQWYGGWPRRFLRDEVQRADKHAKWMRWLYHLGILSLLGGLTALVWPPAGAGGSGRWALVVVGAIGVIAEVVWILMPLIRSWLDAIRRSRHQLDSNC
jgi:hypothetical protein